MKSHQVAEALTLMADKLKAGPNVDIKETSLLTAPPAPALSTDNLTVGLSLLLQLSKVNKREWMQFIQEHRLPVAVEARDSSRNILGKLLNYLEKHPEAQKDLSAKSLTASETSPKLARALQVLMGD